MRIWISPGLNSFLTLAWHNYLFDFRRFLFRSFIVLRLRVDFMSKLRFQFRIDCMLNRKNSLLNQPDSQPAIRHSNAGHNARAEPIFHIQSRLHLTFVMQILTDLYFFSVLTLLLPGFVFQNAELVQNTSYKYEINPITCRSLLSVRCSMELSVFSIFYAIFSLAISFLVIEIAKLIDGTQTLSNKVKLNIFFFGIFRTRTKFTRRA